MAVVKGLGSCAIQKENGSLCGKQIQEGEPIGTVIIRPGQDPIIGHKSCADGYNARKMARENAMKIGKQNGPGGSIGDTANYPDALAFGSMPLEKPEDKPYEPLAGPPELDKVAMPEGVTPLSELPMDDEPAPAPERNIYRDGYHPSTEAADLKRQLADTLSEEEREIAAIRAKYASQREPITHVITIDMSTVPDRTERLQINLEW